MRVIALMSWYEESPTWLAACVTSAARLASHVVAVDGAYAHYPGGRASSGVDQSNAVRMAAEAAGIGCTIHVPRSTWRGDEVAKRGFMFRAGQLVAEPERDWFFVIDADEMVTECNLARVREHLASTDHDVATVLYETYRDLTEKDESLSAYEHRSAHPARRLFRATHEPIRVEGQHWHYVGDYDGTEQILWGTGEVGAELIDCVRMEHRTLQRPPSRRVDAQRYYELRDALRLESSKRRQTVAS